VAESLPTQIELVVVTPDRQLVRDEVESVTIPGRSGYLGILPGHAALLTELGVGRLSYAQRRRTSYVCIVQGVAEVLPGRVLILANTAERSEDIDVERAQSAQRRAEDRLKKLPSPDIDEERARQALRRAIARLETAHHSKSS
jgi:F-type H+-transporting ATPase subunit epsilon